MHADIEQGRQRAAQGHEGEYQVDPLLPAPQKDHQMQKHDGKTDAADGDVTIYEEMLRHARSVSKVSLRVVAPLVEHIFQFLHMVGACSKHVICSASSL